MESKNVKIIDEHGIDRDANIICKFIVDNIDYVLYSIERDNENDNLFVSKLAKNNDGTSNMVNIEDNFEKSKINDIVKQLITYAINSEASVVNGSVTLSDGKRIDISNVIFNKEQKINVPKTYVTTVKKSVTRVSEKFYKVENKPVTDLEKTVVFETLPETEINNNQTTNVESALEMAMPELNLDQVVETKPEEAIENNLQSSENIPSDLGITLDVQEKEPEIVSSPVPQVEEVKEQINPSEVSTTQQFESEIKQVEPEVVIPKIITPVTNETKNPEAAPLEEVKPLVVEDAPAQVKETEVQTNEEIKSEELKDAMNIAATQQVQEVRNAAPLFENQVLPAQVKSEIPVPSVDTATPSISPEPKLFFDGTNESNLNKALDEVSEQKVVSAPQDGVQSLREFGTDESQLVSNNEIHVEQNVKTLTRSKGFANNKFFMIIAIVFFLAACVFLGYEAFQYFQLTA